MTYRKILVLWLVMLMMGPLQFGPGTTVQTVSAQTEPPLNGDWIISDVTSKTNTLIEMNGNITVQSGGVLILDQVDLVFNTSGGREYLFRVNSGGTLSIDNSSVGSSNPEDGYTIDIRGQADVRYSVITGGGRFLDPRAIKLISSDVLFTNNHIVEANNTAISIYPGMSPEIRNNTIDGGGTGIFIYDNDLSNPKNRPVIANNTIRDTSENGIYVGENTNSAIVLNRIENPGNRGIHIQFTEGDFLWNTISGAMNEACIFLYGGSNLPEPRIRNNTLQDCVYGFTSSGQSRGIFEDNHIAGSHHSGMIIQYSSEIVVRDNDITGSMGNGITIRENADPLIDDNELQNNKYHIRLIQRGMGTIIDNRLDGGQYGVYSRDSSPVIENNRFREQSFSSIYISDEHYSRSPIITGNDISFSGKGIELKRTTVEVRNNEISYTNDSGVEVNANVKADIIGNELLNNKMSGVTVQSGAEPEIFDNYFQNNLYGISLLDADVLIENNTFYFNDFAVDSENGDESIFVDNTFQESKLFHFICKSGSHPIVRSSPFNKTRVAADQSSSVLIEWVVNITIEDSMGRTLEDVEVSFYDEGGELIHYDKSEVLGVLPSFRLIEAEVGYEGINDFGPFNITLVKDGATNYTVMNISSDLDTTLYLNHLPVLDLEELFVIEGKEEIIDLTEHLEDEDGEMEDIVVTTDAASIDIDNSEHIMTVLYDDEINYDIVTLNVSDGVTTVSKEIIVHVTPMNDRPTFSGEIRDSEVMEDTVWSLNLSEYFDDEEFPDGLLFTTSHKQIEIDNETQMAYWRPEIEGDGLETVVIRAMDMADLDYYAESNPFDLELIQVNDRPEYLGGLENTSVEEDSRWEIFLPYYFDDEECKEGLTYEASNPSIMINDTTMKAWWAPEEGDVSIVGLTFTAIDEEDPQLTATSQPITLTFIPVDDPPRFVEACLEGVPSVIYPEQTWQLILTDCFIDEENDLMKYESNYESKIELVKDSLGRVKAVWAPEDKGVDIQIKNLVFYASQTEGESKGRRATSDAINVTFKTNRTNKPPDPKVIITPAQIPWYVYAAIPIGIVGTAGAFYTYRRIRFHDYSIQDVFLIFNDGRLITHLTGGGEVSEIDEDILASMLTAIQDFVKESLSRRKVGSLDEMKYGDLKILIERGIFAYLAIVISGNVTEKLKDDMKDALRNIERRFANNLETWDGDNKKLVGLRDEIVKLIDKQPKNIMDLLKSY